MKILFVGTQIQPDNMEYHVTEALQSMGHTVFHFDIKTLIPGSPKLDRYGEFIARMILREPERIREKALADYMAKIQPDLVIVLLGYIVSPKTIALLKKHTVAPVVCWCQDAISNLGRQYMLGAPYDLVFVKDHYMEELFNQMLGNRFRYLPEACNPRMHFYETPPQSQHAEYACDVTTAATLYYYRQELLKPLKDRYRLKVWGNVPDWLAYELGGSHTRRYISGQTKRYAFSAAHIVLNTLHYAEIDGVNCRFFEVPGCGGFQLVSEKAQVADYFQPGREIETFRNQAELREKIDFYLREPTLRADIARNGLQRAHAEHTYEHRLQALIDAAMAL
jgi:spore maturation protein CgeB